LLSLSPFHGYCYFLHRRKVGDNDWNDCSNPSMALSYWNTEFVSFESRFWSHSFPIIRQNNYPSNFAFVHRRTLFIGLNLVGGRVHNQTEWNNRLEDEIQWTISLMNNYTSVMNRNSVNIFHTQNNQYANRVVIFGHCEPKPYHDRYFIPLSNFIQYQLKNRIPILYIHGDRHRWLYTPNFMEQSSFLRISLVGLAAERPLKVDIMSTNYQNNTVDIESAFQIQRQNN
jgi:hypothetical protein